MKYYIFLILIIFANILYPLVIVEGKINKKNIYKWQTIKYSLEFIGDSETFKAEGLNENAISDFKVIKKEIEKPLKAINKATIIFFILFSKNKIWQLY